MRRAWQRGWLATQLRAPETLAPALAEQQLPPRGLDTAVRSDSESDPDSPATRWRKRLSERRYGPDPQKRLRTTCMYGDLLTLGLSRLYV
jgi:hypothetical protein